MNETIGEYHGDILKTNYDFCKHNKMYLNEVLDEGFKNEVESAILKCDFKEDEEEEQDVKMN